MPTEEEVTGEINKRKVATGLSAEEWDKQMKDAGWNEKTYREYTKQRLAIDKLTDKITSRIDAPKDSEIEAFITATRKHSSRNAASSLPRS